MQPTLNKIHSLDYPTGGTSQRGSFCTISNRGAHLMHSVSIVVELAREQQPSASLQSPSLAEDEAPQNGPTNLDENCSEVKQFGISQQDLSIGMANDGNDYCPIGAANGQPTTFEPCSAQASATSDATRDYHEAMSLDEDEEDDEEEDAECLSSDLARKVVIVDEADKILRFRAQSAEPSIEPSAPRSPAAAAAAIKHTQLSGPPPPIPARATRRLNTVIGLTEGPFNQGQMAAAATTAAAAAACHSSTCSSMTTVGSDTSAEPTAAPQLAPPSAKPSAGPTEPGGWWQPSSNNGSELAERGELSKLSMARNTHHCLAGPTNRAPPPPLPLPPGHSGPTPPPVGASSIVAGPSSIVFGMRSPLMGGQQEQSDGNSSSGSHSAGWSQKQHVRSGSAQLERGSLGLLIQLASAKGNSGGGGGGGSGLLVRRAAAEAQILPAPKTNPVYANSNHQQQKLLTQNGPTNKKNCSPQRRQSLQTSLLTKANSTGGNSGNSSACGVGIDGGGSSSIFSSSQSKLLTEEELRGEREFNEQVRSAKSIDIFAGAALGGSGSAGGSSSSCSNYNKPQGPGVLSGSVGGRRCQSVTGPFPIRGTLASKKFESTSPPIGSCELAGAGGVGELSSGGSGSKLGATSTTTITTTTTAATATSIGSGYHQIVPHSIVKTHHHHHLHQKSQRRVSFGSIDPVLVRASDKKHTRASFAFQPSNTHYSHYNSPLEQSDNSQIGGLASNEDSNDNKNNSSNNRKAPSTNIRTINGKGISHQTQPACLLSEKNRRHSIATNTSALSSKTKQNNLKQQKTVDHQFMDPNSLSGERVAKLASSSNDSNQENLDTGSHNLRDSEADGAEVSTLITTTSTKIVGRKMSLNTDTMAEFQDVRPSLQENSVDQQMDQQRKLGDKDYDDDDEAAAPAQASDNWTITSSTNTTTPFNDPTNKQQQATNKPSMKDGSRVQSIMANAKLRQEEFARLLEEHEQIVNEINRVETKISNNNNSQTNLQQQQQQPNTAPQQEQESKQ